MLITSTSRNGPQMSEPIELTIAVTSFEDLYLREYPGLIAVATALSGYDGEDLVQDAMVRALVNWKKLQQLERPGGWCHRVLVNLCRSRWRRRVTEARFYSRLRRDEPTAPAPSDDVMSFWSAVRELPERPRLAIALRYAGDHSVAEIAGVLGVPEGTVRSDLSRARSYMLGRLGAQNDEH
jgi:RNA polymerase sigma-70 factor, ECF subfamily